MFIERSINFHKSASRTYANDDPDDPSRLTDKSCLVDPEVRAAGSAAARRATNSSWMPRVYAPLVARVINRSTEIAVVTWSDVSNGAQEEEATEDGHCVRASRCTCAFLILAN